MGSDSDCADDMDEAGSSSDEDYSVPGVPKDADEEDEDEDEDEDEGDAWDDEYNDDNDEYANFWYVMDRTTCV